MTQGSTVEVFVRYGWWAAAAALVLIGFALPATASAGDYAPPGRPGPALTVPGATLSAALACGPGVAGAARPAVLLVAGTGATPEANYSWNYEPAFTARGIPWCGITVPDHTLADIQDQAEYIVYAIRAMHAMSGQRVSILGYSQGGMTPRWALRFWPDARAMVDDMISLAGDNHGTSAAQVIGACASECPAAAWQNVPGSHLLDALNSPAETFAGISYSQIYTDFDELSTPAGPHGTSPLHSGAGEIANVSLQDICPGHVAEHALVGTTDAVGWALVVDALEHRGPADASRIGSSPCTQPALPGVDPVKAAAAAEVVPYLLAATTPINIAGVKKLRAEPPLRCYVFAACTESTLHVRARLRGDLRRSSLTLTVSPATDDAPLQSIRVRLPAGMLFTRAARTRLRLHADARAGSRGDIVVGRRAVTLQGPSAGALRLSLRAPAGTLALGPRLRARLAAGRHTTLRVRCISVDGRARDVAVEVSR